MLNLEISRFELIRFHCIAFYRNLYKFAYFLSKSLVILDGIYKLCAQETAWNEYESPWCKLITFKQFEVSMTISHFLPFLDAFKIELQKR